jgi:drug/metabolite transporter (DMT)-like permease
MSIRTGSEVNMQSLRGVSASNEALRARKEVRPRKPPRIALSAAAETRSAAMALTATTTLADRAAGARAAPGLVTSAVSRSDIAWLALWMTGTLLSFTTVAVSVRALAGTLSAFEMMTVRSAFGLAVMLAILAARPGRRRDLSLRRLRLHGLRNTLHFASQMGWIVAVTLLPLATVFALEFTMPAWVAVLAVLLLGERMTASRVGALVLCFAGVLVIVRPGLGGFQPAALIALGTALAFAMVAIATKKLISTESTFAILFWMNLMQLPMNFAGSDPLFMLRLDWWMTLPLLGVGIAGLSTHFCLTNAFRHGDASVVIPLDFLRVPFIAVVGALVYAEPLDAPVFAGAGLILAGIVWNLRAEARRA